ncbi:hypothetical protein FVA74_12420 [Salinibacterium sp. dk2585]|uniref:Imm61 family immunity protein n=1 Tax=unclassified Salinibacterium TaxID=2632331 RepID=UPI0011C250DB|nr:MULTISPECIES: Imm61 family immunity protein [unclassified Salinibacterium]QEE62291.1 hypothetical protein FVA74_12420 [Salinibacterium sp. dk2585]TXK53642.1 hypothetical protein FVP63_10690 [Salinibacterium sp. dk5596]
MEAGLLEAVSANLGEWAAEAGYDIISDSGAVVIANGGGEIRFYVRRRDGQFEVSRAERSEDEELRMITHDLVHVVRFLTVRLATSIRSSRGLDLTAVFLPSEELAPGAELRSAHDDPRGPMEGVVLHGEVEALFPEDPEPWDAVEFSHYADKPIELIRASFLDPHGAPLFEHPAASAPEHRR